MLYSSFRRAALLAAVTFCTSLQAESRFTESFDSPSGDLPTGWLLVSAIKTGGGACIAPFPGETGMNSLLLQRPAGAKPENAVVWYTGTPDGVADGKLRNFSGSVILRQNKGPQSTRGVVIRAGNQEYSHFEGYYIALVSEKGNEGLGIYKNPPDHLLPGEELAFTPLAENFHPDRTYLLRFSARGGVIEASLSTVDTLDREVKHLATVTAEGVAEEAGFFGFRSGYANSGPISTWFRSLNLEIE